MGRLDRGEQRIATHRSDAKAVNRREKSLNFGHAENIPNKPPPNPPPSKPPPKGDHVFLVDGSSYIFRAYHALPPLNRKSDGLQVNAVLGFCNMLWKLLRDMPPDNRPTHLAIVFDKSEITFRNKLYPDYKAHRPPAPDDLIPQFALIREAVRAFDLPCLEQAGFEADDLIATYVREACERGATATIVSSDKDLMQLVTDCVTMYDTMKDRRIGIAEVIEKFGVPPEKVVEVQALAGDSTDNVPGVPGHRRQDRRAADRRIWRSREAAAQRAGEIKQPKRREALIENAEKARISRQLVLLDDKVELDVPLDELAVHEPDARKLIAFLKAMEFSTLTRRVAEYSQIDPADVEADRGATRARRVRSPAPKSPVCSRQARRPVRRRRAQALLATAKRPARPTSRSDRPTTARALRIARRGARGSRAQAPRSIAANTRPSAASTSSTPGSRACTMPVISPSRPRPISIDPMQAEICGIALALAPNDACYVPLSHKQSGDGAGLFAAGIAPDQIKTDDALEALRPLLEFGGHSQDRLQHQVQRRDVRAAWRHHSQPRRRAADVLRARCRPQRARARRAGRTLARPRHHELRRTDRQRQGQAQLRSGRDRQGDGVLGRGCRRDPAAVAGAQAAAGRRAHDRGL